MSYKEELEATEKELQKMVLQLQQQQVMVNRMEGIAMYLRGKVAEEQKQEVKEE